MNGDNKRWATAYWTISDRDVIPIFCMMRVLCVLTVLTDKCRLLAISVIDLPPTSSETAAMHVVLAQVGGRMMLRFTQMGRTGTPTMSWGTRGHASRSEAKAQARCFGSNYNSLGGHQ